MRSRDFPFACVWGQPPRRVLQRAVQGAVSRPGFRILVEPASLPWLVAELPGWWRDDDVLIHRWKGDEPRLPSLPAGISIERVGEGGVERTEDPDPQLLAELPDDLRPELELALGYRCPMTVAWAEDRGRRAPVSFCYAPWKTETLWDVSVDTLEPYRRRGLAAAVFETLRRHLAEQGLTPVWGAMAGNLASRRLAAKLGFEETARRATFGPPRR